VSPNIYAFGEAPKESRFAVCVKCKKVQQFDAPGDWRPECCQDTQTVTAVDLFKTLGKVPKGDNLPPGIVEVRNNLLQLLKLVTDAADLDAKENSEKDA
jgi:hypothetical protein